MKLVCQGDIRFPVSTVAPFVIKGSQSMCLPTDELVKKIYLVQPNKIPVCHWKRREVCKGDSRASVEDIVLSEISQAQMTDTVLPGYSRNLAEPSQRSRELNGGC